MKNLARVLDRLIVIMLGLAVLILTVAHYFWVVMLAAGLAVVWRAAFSGRL